MAFSSTITADTSDETTTTASRSASRSSTKVSNTSTTSGSRRSSTSTQSKSRSITSTSSSTYTTSTASTELATSASITSASTLASTPTISQATSNFGKVRQVNVGAIVGCVVAVVTVMAALITFYCWWRARHSRQERQSDFARTSVLRNNDSFDHDPESARPSPLPKTAKACEYQVARTLSKTRIMQNSRSSYTPINHETSFGHSYYAPIASHPPPARSPARPTALSSSVRSPTTPSLPFTCQPLIPPHTISHNRDSIPDFNSTLYTHDKDELDTDILPRVHPAFRPHSYSLSAVVTHNSGASKPRRASHSGHIYAPLSQEETPRIYGMPIPEIEIMDADMNTYRKEP